MLTMFTGYMFGDAIFRSQLPDSPSMVSSHPLTAKIKERSCNWVLFDSCSFNLQIFES